MRGFRLRSHVETLACTSKKGVWHSTIARASWTSSSFRNAEDGPPGNHRNADLLVSSTMQPDALSDALERVPRCVLGTYPTPLVRLERLSRELGREVYVKRDDSLGPAGGGNKTRKLEYLLADAIEAGAEKVVTVGGPQSNHARLTAAAARMLGLEPHLLLFGSQPKRAVGNLLLDQLLGANLHFIPPGPIASKPCTFDELDAYVREEASQRVGDHYHVPLGGSNGLGSVGYVRAALEIVEQANSAGVADAWIVIATGSGGTLAGLLAGLRSIGSSLRLVGIDVASIWTSYPELVARIANEALEQLGLPALVEPVDVALIEHTYVGRGYAVPTTAGIAAIRRLAQTEGLLLDPTYTGKAFAGLLGLHETGHFGDDEPVIFWHTGGMPGLFTERV
jgi:D-cysteine desulfhydrase family pyridoxal phosphate-dependent enzyme